MNGTKSIRFAVTTVCVCGVVGLGDAVIEESDAQAAPTSGITTDVPSTAPLAAPLHVNPQQSLSRLPPAFRPKDPIGTTAVPVTPKVEQVAPPDPAADVKALKAMASSAKPSGEIGGTGGSEKSRADALKENLKATEAAPPEFGASGPTLAATAMGNGRGVLFGVKNNGLSVAMPKFRTLALRGWDVWVAVGIYDNNTGALIDRPGLILQNNVPYDDTAYATNLTFQLDTSKYKTANAVIYLETWVKPGGSAASQWQFLNSLPEGAAQITNGKTVSFTPYAIGYLSGRRFSYTDSGFGTVQGYEYRFDYNSRNDCIQYEASYVGSTSTMSFYRISRGCAMFEQDRLALHSDYFETEKGKQSDNRWLWADRFQVSPSDLVVLNPWAANQPGKWMRLAGVPR